MNVKYYESMKLYEHESVSKQDWLAYDAYLSIKFL